MAARRKRSVLGALYAYVLCDAAVMIVSLSGAVSYFVLDGVGGSIVLAATQFHRLPLA